MKPHLLLLTFTFLLNFSFYFTGQNKENFEIQSTLEFITQIRILWPIKITYNTAYKLKDAQGRDLDLHIMQGGEFSPGGELLYLSNGAGNCKGIGASDPGQAIEGINTFEDGAEPATVIPNRRICIIFVAHTKNTV